jgi:lipid A disaccharide synthetase
MKNASQVLLSSSMNVSHDVIDSVRNTSPRLFVVIDYMEFNTSMMPLKGG